MNGPQSSPGENRSVVIADASAIMSQGLEKHGFSMPSSQNITNDLERLLDGDKKRIFIPIGSAGTEHNPFTTEVTQNGFRPHLLAVVAEDPKTKNRKLLITLEVESPEHSAFLGAQAYHLGHSSNIGPRNIPLGVVDLNDL